MELEMFVGWTRRHGHWLAGEWPEGPLKFVSQHLTARNLSELNVTRHKL